MARILELSGVSKAFGAVKVAQEQSWHLEEGEALGVLGPNGAGKTTLFNLITGTLAPNAGEIRYLGQDITRWAAAKRCRAGVARSFQVPQPFGGISIFENVLVAATAGAGLRGRAAEAHCLAVLEETELLPKANRLAGALTLLDRKRLELARALAARPKLLLLDEIAGGLTESECVALIATIKAVRARGVSIVWIEHVVHALLAVVDRLMVIDFGRVIASGAPEATLQSPEVRAIYLGIDADA